MTHTLVSGVRDTQCGFKFFDRDAVSRALAQCRTTGFAFDVELLRRIQADGGSIVEIPVAWTDDPRSTFRPIPDGVGRASRRCCSCGGGDRRCPRRSPRTAPSLLPGWPGMRVLVLNWRDVRHPQAGGAEQYMHQIARRWVAAGAHVTWFTARPGGQQAVEVHRRDPRRPVGR